MLEIDIVAPIVAGAMIGIIISFLFVKHGSVNKYQANVFGINSNNLITGITLFTISEVVEKGKKFKKEDLDSSLPSSDSIYTLSYTSGTTDDPKAVILTHGNFVSASSSIF